MNSCLICGGQYFPSDYPGLLRCGSCGFLTANLRLGEEQLRSLYSHAYFCGHEYRDYLEERSVQELNFRARLDTLLRFVPHPESRHLIEIGCAYGFFLKMASECFASAVGIDISEKAVLYARNQLGCSVFTGNFDEYQQRIDVAVMWDTIEHLARPDAYIHRLGQVMSRGGIVAITTGDLGSLVARTRKAKWRQIHPPTHLHYFSESTLSQMLRQNSFKIRLVQHCGFYRTLDTALYTILVLRHSYPGIYRLLKRSRLLGIPFYLNLYDTLLVIAEKD